MFCRTEEGCEGTFAVGTRVAEDKILGVDDLLGRFRTGGEADSSGSFTLDPKKALERLAKFQLPGPNHWVLKVVQCLHRSGANQIKVDGGVNTVSIYADASPEGFASMDDLLTQLIADAEHCDPALRHLAAGLQGSLAVSPNRIRLSITQDSETREYFLRSGGWREGQSKGAPPSSNRFELELTRNLSEKLGQSWFLLNADIFDLLFRRKAALERENKQVNEHCMYSASEIVLRNRPLQSNAFGQPRFKGYDIRSDSDPGQARPKGLKMFNSEELVDNVCNPYHHLVEEVVPSEIPGGFRLEADCHATVSNREDSEIKEMCSKNGLARACAIRMPREALCAVHFWEDGVRIGRETPDMDCPGFVAVVDARGLGKDLTTLQVSKDARYEKLMDELKETAQRLRAKVQENMHLMPPSNRVASALGLQRVD